MNRRQIMWQGWLLQCVFNVRNLTAFFHQCPLHALHIKRQTLSCFFHLHQAFLQWKLLNIQKKYKTYFCLIFIKLWPTGLGKCLAMRHLIRYINQEAKCEIYFALGLIILEILPQIFNYFSIIYIIKKVWDLYVQYLVTLQTKNMILHNFMGLVLATKV